MGCTNSVNIAGQVQIEVFHRYNLGIAATSRTTLNTKSGTLGRLTNAGEDSLTNIMKSLAQANGGNGFTLAQRRWGDRGHINVFSIGGIF